MGSKDEEIEKSVDFLEGPRPSNIRAKSASSECIHGLDILVHCSSPPLASQLPQADRPRAGSLHLQGTNHNGQVKDGATLSSSD